MTESVIISHLNNGPVIASVDASQPVFIYYSGGILNSYSCKKNYNNHWVVIVGYSTDYYIIRNSWGNSWGLETLSTGESGKGYAYLSRHGDGNGICGVQMQPRIVTTN